MKNIKETIDYLNKEIQNWTHPTLWEEANCRLLKRFKSYRTKLEKSLKNIEYEENKKKVRDRRKNENLF